MIEPIAFVLTDAEASERLDRVLAARDLGYSRSTLQRFIEEGRVSIDGAPATRRSKLRAGARIVVHPSPPLPSSAEPEDLPLEILHEDDAVLVLDKPAGLVVHPAPGHASGTLVNALLHHTKIELDDDEEDLPRPGIVHRLDKDTSGVMVVAKTAQARESLIAQFQVHSIERRYVAIAVGATPDAVTYDTTHGRHPRDRKRFTSKLDHGKRAITHLVTKERLHGASLVECKLDTGRTHQIRVHLAEHGHPLLGDPMYGKPAPDARVRAAARDLGRQALHAAVLGFAHPTTSAPMRFERDAPSDFQAALSALR